MTGPAGAAEAGDATVSGTTLSGPLLGDLPIGTYTVTWRPKPERAGRCRGYGLLAAPVDG